jgi:predicted Zn-dependent peptidase
MVKVLDYTKLLTIKNGFWFNNSQEDYGTYILYGLPQAPFTSENILTEIDAEIVKLQTELISDKELKLQNKYENQYVNSNASIEGIASNLATFTCCTKTSTWSIQRLISTIHQKIRTVAKNT